MNKKLITKKHSKTNKQAAMSIEMDNPKTIMEKVDAASNLIEQMCLAHMIRDEITFRKAHKKAGDLLLDVMQKLEEKSVE